jgi:hypothetical protein
MKSDKYGSDMMLDAMHHSEYKEGSKYPLSKFDFELFDEAKAIPGTVVRVKRVASAAKGERWRILENDELKFVVDGEKLSKKECMFLRTLDGVNFLIGEFKVGFKSLNELRGRLKKKIV